MRERRYAPNKLDTLIAKSLLVLKLQNTFPAAPLRAVLPLEGGRIRIMAGTEIPFMSDPSEATASWFSQS